VIRYVQTPTSAGYGFGASVVVAGLVLVPFSLASVTASRLAPMLGRWISADLVLPVGCVIFVGATLLFLGERGELWELFLVLGLAGLGVGCTFAALPGLIVRSVPPGETGSAMSFNQVLRYVGYSVGSALSATLLEGHTAAGAVLPLEVGYEVTAWVGCAVLLLAAVLSFALPRTGAAFDAVLVEETIADAVPYEESRAATTAARR
jgi:predicted MFS family arabinose efflux permease